MLTITKLTNAEYLLSQVALGIDDYYMGVGEAPGVWQGRLADQLGLTGVVDADVLRALLLGRDPGTDVDLLAGRPERRVSAFDMTFSAPKSVSLLWAFASSEVSSVASIAHVEAVAVALEFLERRAGATRQQVDGERQRTPAGVAAATFVHRTSREGDPQLHTHCVVDGIQGGTWTQVHLLGTAALERFTGYVGQSRSQHPTHTWNVSRLPDIDHGGVLADQRTPDREVLNALLRVPDTGFAAHDDPERIRRLLEERAEHRAVLAASPPDRRSELRRAEGALHSAEKERYWAQYRLDAAHERLARIGRLSLVRRHGRHERTSTLEDIERFQGDVGGAADKVERCERNLNHLLGVVAQGDAWHAEHDWRHGRLGAIDTELADLGHIDLRDISLPERAQSLVSDRPRTTGMTSPLGRAPRNGAEAGEVPAWWAERLAEIAAPPPPGRDTDLGIDLGLWPGGSVRW